MGHGKSEQFKTKISLKAVAKNLSDLIIHLGLASINVIGYSYGGETLFQLALLNPGLIESMIIIGSCGTWHVDDFPEFKQYFSFKNIENLPWLREQQINEARIKNILEQLPNYSVSVTEDELKSIKARTLIVVGDNDHATPMEDLSGGC